MSEILLALRTAAYRTGPAPSSTSTPRAKAHPTEFPLQTDKSVM